MSKTKRVERAKPVKPDKPTPEFPLFPHASGQWAAKINGSLHYFGVWRDPQAALARFNQEYTDLKAGRKPRTGDSAELTVRDLVNRFLTAKNRQLQIGQLSEKSWVDYKRTCQKVAAAFGTNRLVSDLQPEDFGSFRSDLAKNVGALTLSHEISRTRTLFRWGCENNVLAAPVRFGSDFKKPSARTLLMEQADGQARWFAPEEVRRMIEAAPYKLKALLLLAINAAIGNKDLALLPLKALDLESGWLDYRRGKTGRRRRAKLWPETVEAVREVLRRRKPPACPEDAALVFLNKQGLAYVRGPGTDGIRQETAKLMKKLGILKPGVKVYGLRHSWRTVVGGRDDMAAALAMGHAGKAGDMRQVYVHEIADERLIALSDLVHNWLYPHTLEVDYRAD